MSSNDSTGCEGEADSYLKSDRNYLYNQIDEVKGSDQ